MGNMAPLDEDEFSLPALFSSLGAAPPTCVAWHRPSCRPGELASSWGYRQSIRISNSA